MRWTPGGQRDDIEDRRGTRMRAGAGIGIGGLLILGLLTLVTGRNFLSLAPLLESSGPVTQQEESGPIQSTPEEDRRVQFVSFVLDDAQDTWRKKLGDRYQDTKLLLFPDAVSTGCGYGQAASCSFSWPLDQKVYIDVSFYDELQSRFGATGEFAQAYVLAHEIGHHVQHLLGIEPQVRRAMQQRPDLQNDLSVRLELQADCFAGVWGNSTNQRQILEQGDIESGLRAAAAIGDDRIPRQTRASGQPEWSTPGPPAQRGKGSKRGLQRGDPQACDTFKGGE